MTNCLLRAIKHNPNHAYTYEKDTKMLIIHIEE